MSQIESLVEIDKNPMTISCHLSGFHLFAMLKHDMDFGQVQGIGIFMASAEKMMGFSSNSVSFCTKLPSKRHEKICVIFCTEKSFVLPSKTATELYFAFL